MGPSQQLSQDNLLKDTVLGSNYFNPDYLFNQGLAFFRGLYDFITGNGSGIVSVYHNILIILSIFFLTVISYATVRLFEIRAKERKHLEHEIDEYAHRQAEREKKLQAGEAVSKNERWLKTLSYLFSQHASDWKLAIIEADSMLESLMDQLGFKGETFGDKLKSTDQEKFKGLTSAWEVHTIRNRIAHEGTSFELSQREAKRAIALYEQIFRQYGYI